MSSNIIFFIKFFFVFILFMNSYIWRITNYYIITTFT